MSSVAAEAAALFDPRIAGWMREQAQALVADTPFHRFCGLHLLRLEPGLCRLGFTATPETLVMQAYLHGGILTALLEPAAFLALLTALEPSERPVTVDLNVQQMRAIPAGSDVLIEGRLERRARNLAFCESRAYVDGKLTSVARMTKSIQAASPAPASASAPVPPPPTAAA